MDLASILLGIVVLLFALTVPGYCIALAVFPRRSDIDLLERLALSFVFSIVFLPLLMLIENQLLGIPINQISSAASVLVLIIAGLAVWMIRTSRIKAPGVCYKIFPKVDEKDAMPLLAWQK